jgi:hypothetical protein
MVLLVGGLFVLGLLCGERAHAVDGVVPTAKPTESVRSVTSSAEQVARGTGTGREWTEWMTSERSPGSDSASTTASQSTPSQSQAASPSSASPSPSGSSSGSGFGSGPGSKPPGLSGAITLATDEVPRVVRPVAEGVVRPVTGLVTSPAAEHVVPPVGDLVDQITAGITDQVGGGIDEQPAPPPWWSSLPRLPTLPDLPDGLPGLPELPGLPLPVVPGQTLPAGTAAQQQPGGAVDGHQAAGKPSHRGSASVYGPRFAGGPGPTAGDDARHPTHTHITGAVQAPAHQIPDGDPTDTSGRHSAGDNGSPRHGDAQAVTSNERARSAVAPGATADVPAARARDRHRDVPAFPG